MKVNSFFWGNNGLDTAWLVSMNPTTFVLTSVYHPASNDQTFDAGDKPFRATVAAYGRSIVVCCNNDEKQSVQFQFIE